MLSASTREQKQILADIQSGSQKFGRRLSNRNVTGHRREKSGDTLIPVTILGSEASGSSEDRRGRKSTNSQRPGLLKRSSSMKKAYNYFFGGGQPVPAPAEPSSPVTSRVTAAPKDEDLPRESGIDTPPETPREPPAREGEVEEEATGTSRSIPLLHSQEPGCPQHILWLSINDTKCTEDI
jgi:hypothetical protein